AWSWQQRAINEYRTWSLTLFGTVTMSPEEHYALDARIMSGTMHPRSQQWLRQPKRLSELSPRELFAARVTEFGAELQSYLKRVRKAAGPKSRARYLLVAEAHDSAKTSLE